MIGSLEAIKFSPEPNNTVVYALILDFYAGQDTK